VFLLRLFYVGAVNPVDMWNSKIGDVGVFLIRSIALKYAVD
jgi:hypothetical protein